MQHAAIVLREKGVPYERWWPSPTGRGDLASLWAKPAGVEWHPIDPRTADARHGICEAFDGRTRDDLLDEPLFRDLDRARSAIARRVVG